MAQGKATGLPPPANGFTATVIGPSECSSAESSASLRYSSYPASALFCTSSATSHILDRGRYFMRSEPQETRRLGARSLIP